MKEKKYGQFEAAQGSMQVILEFSEQSNEEECLKKEIKQILSVMLQEYLQNNKKGGITL